MHLSNSLPVCYTSNVNVSYIKDKENFDGLETLIGDKFEKYNPEWHDHGKEKKRKRGTRY